MKLKDIQDVHAIQAAVAGQATAGTTDEFTVGRVPFRATITAVEFIAAAAVTGAATNNFALDLRNRGSAGTGTTDVATLTFASGTDAVAFDGTALTLSSTASELDVAEGDVLTLEKRVNGTGLAMPDGHIVVLLKAR